MDIGSIRLPSPRVGPPALRAKTRAQVNIGTGGLAPVTNTYFAFPVYPSSPAFQAGPMALRRGRRPVYWTPDDRKPAKNTEFIFPVYARGISSNAGQMVTRRRNASASWTAFGFNSLVDTAGQAALTLTSFAPTALAPRLCTPPVTGLSTATYAPAALTPRLATPSVLAVVTSRYAPSALAPRLVTPAVGAATASLLAPTVLTPILATPGLVAVTTGLYAPTAQAPRYCSPGSAPMYLSQSSIPPGGTDPFAPTVLVPRLVTPGTLSSALVTIPIEGTKRMIAIRFSAFEGKNEVRVYYI